MTSQFTDEQVEAAAEAAHYAQGFDDYGVANSEERAEAEGIARAALEAAAGVAPQVDYDGLGDALFELSHEPSYGDHPDGVAKARAAGVELIARYVGVAPPVQPPSTVDQEKLAEVLHLANHEGCQSVIPTQAERHAVKAIADHLRGASL